MSTRKHRTLRNRGNLRMCDFREFREFRDFREFRVFDLAERKCIYDNDIMNLMIIQNQVYCTP